MAGCAELSPPTPRLGASPSWPTAPGSTADFVTRAVGGPLSGEGWTVTAVDDRSGAVEQVQAAVAASVRRTGARLAGGVSLGAHAVARWAASAAGAASGIEGLLLVLPAWTGPPGPVAALSSLAAGEVDRLGPDAVVRSVDDGSWVGTELAAAWPTYGSGLAAALRATARSPGPTLDELARIEVPVGLVGFVGDPFHPVEVAREWCEVLPRAVLVELEKDAPGTDRSVLGRAALAALAAAARA